MRQELSLRRCRPRFHSWSLQASSYAQALLDLVKAFERIPYRVLLREARKLGYPLRMLRLTIATYRLPRVIRVGEALSDPAWALRGIVARSGTATTEMRLAMITIVDNALTWVPTVVPTLFVDDLSTEAEGSDDDEDDTTTTRWRTTSEPSPESSCAAL